MTAGYVLATRLLCPCAIGAIGAGKPASDRQIGNGGHAGDIHLPTIANGHRRMAVHIEIGSCREMCILDEQTAAAGARRFSASTV